MKEERRLNDQVGLSTIEAAVLGSTVGDALGVPVEFRSRQSLRRAPVVGMRAFGTHHQPSGTWSDDSSLMLCLAESLTERGVDFHDQAARFVSWLREGVWTPHGEVFDIGNATREAIHRLEAGIEPTSAGAADESSCGNGSLMRILPVGLYLASADREVRAGFAADCSRLTHGHARCQLACVMFTEIVASLVRGKPWEQSLSDGREVLNEHLTQNFPEESAAFERLSSSRLPDLDEDAVSSSGYVIHCLEASLWCTQRAQSFREGVLMAVNLGDDTDTTGAVAGALLGLRFGRDAIPGEWIASLARLSDIRVLVERFQCACLHRWRTSE
jgi:ADP-ribosyl-[dinitrogen reductase] hydrolase